MSREKVTDPARLQGKWELDSTPTVGIASTNFEVCSATTQPTMRELIARVCWKDKLLVILKATDKSKGYVPCFKSRMLYMHLYQWFPDCVVGLKYNCIRSSPALGTAYDEEMLPKTIAPGSAHYSYHVLGIMDSTLAFCFRRVCLQNDEEVHIYNVFTVRLP